MPIWLRRYHIGKINDYHRKQEEEQSKASQKNKSTNNKVAGPNINPSSTYNF